MSKLTDTERAKWRNIWCILRSLDWYELEAAGAGDIRDFDWPKFRDSPHAYVIRTDESQAAVIWAAVEKRLK